MCHAAGFVAPTFVAPMQEHRSSPAPSLRHSDMGTGELPAAAQGLGVADRMQGTVSFLVGSALAGCAAAAVRKASANKRASCCPSTRRAGSDPEPSAVGEAPPPTPAFDPSMFVGAVEPLGLFDPLGFTKDIDMESFRDLRESELKHGRVAMLASLGLVVQHFVHIGGERAATGVGALNSLEGKVGLFAVFAWGGVLEYTWKQDPEKEVGNFGDPLGVNMYNLDMRNKELNNGRFAMICVAGIIAAELATGKDAIQQFGF